MRRRTWAAVLAALIGILGGGVNEAAAEEASWNDPAGDSSRCDTDILDVAVSFHDTLSLASTPKCGSDPFTDSRWSSQDLYVNWFVDVDGEVDAEYEIHFGWATGGDASPRLTTHMTRIGDPQPDGNRNVDPVSCAITIERDGPSRHRLSIPTQCFERVGTTVSALRVRMAMLARHASGTYFDGDSAPSAGWSSTIARSVAPPPPPPPPPPPRSGYWMIGTDGKVYAFGDATSRGNAPTTMAEDLESTPAGDGYWIVTSSGVVFIFGNAVQLGGLDGQLQPYEKVTSISTTPTGAGYWLFTNLGRVVAFGDAQHLGDMAGTRLNGPVLDSIPTSTGRGYYMVASDGGIFTFGDASFAGSMGDARLNAPVQSLVPDTDGAGYWLVAADGGIFAFDAPFYGSMGDVRLNRPITGMVASGSGGYLMVGEDGGIFTFGSAAFHGSLGDRPPVQPITSVAVVPH